MIISHVNKKGLVQSNDDHQRGVSDLASRYASRFGMSEWGKVLGLLHDKGKERLAFQQHIKKDSGLDPNIIVDGDYTHAHIGALIAKRLFSLKGEIMTNPIMGHHRGLYDEGEKQMILRNALIPPEVSIENISASLSFPIGILSQDVHHIERFLYSCLVDADYMDTEQFAQPEQHSIRGHRLSLGVLLPRLERFLEGMRESAPDTHVNRIRNFVQKECRAKSSKKPGFFSLTVPTGGGKTLSSILWAMLHAVRHGHERVIIAIPYTSIITQTASILRGIFGADNVLEHHSDFDSSTIEDPKMRMRHRLATENWDYPIVVTTNVQLFESLFSNRPSECRKLHNIARSVIVMDEVQTLPPGYLKPILDTLDTLKRLFGVSVLFTTASQPVLSGTITGTNLLRGFTGLTQICEIIPPETRLHDQLRRVELSFDEAASTYDSLAHRLSSHQQVLCIVNTRKDAREVFRRLPKEGICMHLSRLMYPEHIQNTIERMKTALTDSKAVIRVVATQLVEAGVDIDFPVVYRQEAGLDSILQAAGRCNREGRSTIGSTVVFRFEAVLPPGMMASANNARKNLGSKRDWFSPDTMRDYFRQLYSRVPNFDQADIRHFLYNPSDIQFETAASEFRLIHDDSIPVVIRRPECLGLLSRIKVEGPSYRLLKALSRYSVNIRRDDLKSMIEAGVVEETPEGIHVLRRKECYSQDVGLVMDPNRPKI